MKFSLDFFVDVDGSPLSSSALLANVRDCRGAFSDVSSLEGSVSVSIDDAVVCGGYTEPIVRLLLHFTRKLPWIIGGDTETVALSNSAQCFAFIPEGDSVELSFFNGSESEIEDYILDPVNVRRDLFVQEILRLVGSFLTLLHEVDSTLVNAHEELRDLATLYEEAQRAWKDSVLRARR